MKKLFLTLMLFSSLSFAEIEKNKKKTDHNKLLPLDEQQLNKEQAYDHLKLIEK